VVVSLRRLPEVASVEYSGGREAVVIHLRDWHFVPRELCALEGIDFQGNLEAVAKVQDEQIAVVRFLIHDYGLSRVYGEGLSDEAMPDLRLRIDMLRDLALLEKRRGLDAAARRQQRELTLEVGLPGRLLQSGEIADVLPLEDDKALDDAAPIQTGNQGIRFDAEKVAARRKAMADRLPKEGMALVVLGGSHDLRPYLPPGTLYVRVTMRSYPGDD
jgi:hypothetical protein